MGVGEKPLGYEGILVFLLQSENGPTSPCGSGAIGWNEFPWAPAHRITLTAICVSPVFASRH